MSLSKLLPVALLATLCAAAHSADAPAAFTFKDTPGQHLDVLLGDKPIARYMYAYDTSTKERELETFKPYLHVFDTDGASTITKGPGGRFPHHRGITIGWNKISYKEKSYDRWHMKDGAIIHQKFTKQEPGAEATFTSVTHWFAAKDQPMIEEERTFTFRAAPAPVRVIIDQTSSIKAIDADIKLDGDPEHAGIHFRPANELVDKETTYVFPQENADATKDKDYPWVGETFTLNANKHSVVIMAHPTTPKETRWSAYRDYGRFGAFPVASIKAGESFAFKFRFLVAAGEMPAPELIQKSWDEFAGATTPTPTPKITSKLAKPSAAPAPKKDDKKAETK